MGAVNAEQAGNGAIEISEVIRDVNKGFAADGNGVKEPVPSELPDRLWRADPSDGLRPLKEIRAQWAPIH